MFKDQVSYDRKEKSYRLIDSDGVVYSFPGSGPSVKAQAFQFWLSLEYPTLHKLAVSMADENPFIERQIWKAVELAASKHVEFKNRSGLVAVVQSANDPYGRYAIGQSDGVLVCNCPAFTELAPVYAEIAGNYQQICKHTLACLLLEMTGES